MFYKICNRHIATLHMSTAALLHIGPCGHSSLQSAALVAILHFNRRSLWPFCKSMSAQHSVHAACLAQCLYTLLSSSNMTFCCNSAASVLCTLYVCCKKNCLLQTIPAFYAPSPSETLPTVAVAAAAERCIYVHTDIQVSTDIIYYVPCIHAFHADMHSSSLMHTQLHASRYGLHSLSYLHVVQSGVSTL